MKRKLILFLMVLVLPITVRAEKPNFVNVIKNTECTGSYTWNDMADYAEECVGDECTDITVIGASCKDENYALVGDMCFRVFRTTYTDGVKMLYWGKATDGKCPTTNESMRSKFNNPFTLTSADYSITNELLRYMYPDVYGSSRRNMLGESSSLDYKNSSVLKTNIDLFYKNNLLDYANYFEDAIYCNSMRKSGYNDSYGGQGTSYNYYDDMRYSDDAQLRCRLVDSYTVDNEDGNQALKYPIATMSNHEYQFTVDGWEGSWVPDNLLLMTPRSYSTSSYYSAYASMRTTGNYSSYAVQEASYLPAVSVNKEVLVLAGTGVQNDPYVLGFPEPEPTGVKRQVHTKIVWDDKGNETNSRPSEVTIRIFVNGVEKFKKVVTAEDGWIFDAEIELASANDEVTFSVEQNEVEGYTLSIDQLASNQFVITNTLKTEVKGVEENPKTGIFNYLWILPIIAVVGFIVYKELIKESLFKSN